MISRNTSHNTMKSSHRGAADPVSSVLLKSAINIRKRCPDLSIETLGHITCLAILRQALLRSIQLSWHEAHELGCPLLARNLDQGVTAEPSELLAEVTIADYNSGDDLGGLYQRLCEFSLQLLPDNKLGVGSNRNKRRERGLFFTPAWLAERLANLALRPLLKSDKFNPLDNSFSILDPACGSGRLLIACVKRLLSKQLMMPQHTLDRVALTRRLVTSAIRGIDCDALAVALARANLWLLCDPSQGPVAGLEQAVVTGDAIGGPVRTGDQPDVFLWEQVFAKELAAGGFTVIVSNPPFEVLTGFRSRPELRRYGELIRSSGYKLAFGGNLNTSRLFLERALDVLAGDGHLAFIMPYSFLMDRNAQKLRTHLIRLGWLEMLEVYPESSRVFPLVGQAVILLKVVKNTGAKTNATITIVTDDDTRKAPVHLTLAKLALLDPVALPIPVASAEAVELAERLHAINKSSVGQIAEGRVGEVDQTFYRKYMRSAPGEGQALLLRGAHLSPFHVELGEGDEHERWLDAGGFTQERGRFVDDLRSLRVVQTGIVNLEANRRFVAAMAPAGVYLGNSVNYWVAHPQAHMPEEELNAYLLGLLNSTALEWRFRLTSSNHNINLYEVRALPLPLLTDSFSTERGASFCAKSLDIIRSAQAGVTDIARLIVGDRGAPPREDRAVARLIGKVALMREAETNKNRQKCLEAVLDHLIVWHLGMQETDLNLMLKDIPVRKWNDNQ